MSTEAAQVPYPFPQTIGRVRELNTVPLTPNVAIPRATQPEATSLFTQVSSYVNNFLGNLNVAETTKDAQSAAIAAKVTVGEPQKIPSLLDTFTQSAQKISTLADEFLKQSGYTVSRVDPGAKVEGRPPAPTTTQYQYPNLIDQKVQEVVTKGEQILNQVKGMFNLAYEHPMEQKAVVASSIGGVGGTWDWAFIPILILLFVVIK
jgi:hypothetical protein